MPTGDRGGRRGGPHVTTAPDSPGSRPAQLHLPRVPSAVNAAMLAMLYHAALPCHFPFVWGSCTLSTLTWACTYTCAAPRRAIRYPVPRPSHRAPRPSRVHISCASLPSLQCVSLSLCLLGLRASLVLSASTSSRQQRIGDMTRTTRSFDTCNGREGPGYIGRIG